MKKMNIPLIATLWGIRLTINFARKGAYKLKFWEGVEDYRWAVVRSGPAFKKRWTWMLFDLGFISIYQNALVFSDGKYPEYEQKTLS